MIDDLRETSSATTRLVLGYVRDRAGDEAVRDVLQQADVPYSREQLEEPSSWVSYDARIRLFEAATAVLQQPDAMRQVGASALRQGINSSLVLLLRGFGSPRQVFRSLPRAVTKFSTTSTMQVLEVGATHATISYVLHEGYVHSRLDCQYAQGLFTCVPEVFGLPAAHVVHEECESDGAQACVYHVTWARRSRLSRRSRVDQQELGALRAQLAGLQSAASDLVSSDDVEQVLRRITERAAEAVVAQGYLLAVRPRFGTRPVVQASGVPAARAEQLAGALLRGEDLGPSAVVVDVRSSRRMHGRLAALYPEGSRGLADEQPLLEAYASHAAAALDTVYALQDSRRGQARAQALLELAHALARTTDPDGVVQLVMSTLPRAMGCSSGGLLLWDERSGELRPAGSFGLPPEATAVFLGSVLRPDDVPELAQMLTSQAPLALQIDAAGPALRMLLQVLGVAEVLAVPLIAGGELLGVVTGSWDDEVVLREPEPDLLLRLQGIGDQVATALQNAQLLAEIRHQSRHDALTGLANRVQFGEELACALRHLPSAGGAGVLFCDLDRFKQVNDGLGHACGDEVLRQVAERLRAAVRQQDRVARLSGDEFAVLLPHVLDVQEARAVADRVAAAFERPFRVDGHELRLTTSVGVAVQDAATTRSGALLGAADAAMYVAKQRGRNQVACASTATSTDGPATSIEAELAAALRAPTGSCPLVLHYQPLVEALTGRLVAVEALVRWQHPRLGLLEPGAFLGTAEESGLIVALDGWVLRTACAALAEARLRSPLAPSRVAVNLSSSSLGDPHLLATVREALQASGLAAERLEVEVVESRALVDLVGTTDRLTALRRLGVRVALDDFGTGYSTLTWLHRLPADALKLDRSFTLGVSDSATSAALVRGVVALAGELGLEVVAEGVETTAQLQALRAAGCHLVQGYLVGRPAPDLLPEAVAVT